MLDLAKYVTGGTVTGVAISTGPQHGTASVSGTVVTYTPANNYSGADAFNYTATGVSGSSAPAAVSITVVSRPDPTKDTEVIGLISAQTETAKRFALTQISNFQTHLEHLHARKGNAADEASVSEHRTPESTGRSTSSGRAVTSDVVPTTGSPARTASSVSSSPSTITTMMNDERDPYVLPNENAARANDFPWPSLNLSGKTTNLLGDGLEAWSAGTITIGRQGKLDERFTTSGISMGGDRRFGEELTLGVGAGFGHDYQKIGDNGTHSTGNNYAFTLYGSYQPTEGVFLDGVVGYGHLDFDSQRYASAVNLTTSSQRSGTQWFSSFSGGYEYQNGKLLVSPYARLDLVSSRLGESTENGAGLYDLTYFAQTVKTTKLSFGLRGEGRVELSEVTATPYFRVEYQHDFENPGVATMSYADQLSGPVYQLGLHGVDRDAMVIGLGSDFMRRKSWSLGMGYQYSQGSASSRMHTLGIRFRLPF